MKCSQTDVVFIIEKNNDYGESEEVTFGDCKGTMNWIPSKGAWYCKSCDHYGIIDGNQMLITHYSRRWWRFKARIRRFFNWVRFGKK